MSKDQEYHLLSSDPSEEIESLPAPTWASKFSRTILAGLLAFETFALALTISVLLARAPVTTCTVPLKSQRVLYSPALEAVEYEVKVYHVGSPSDLSPFQIPSSPALDRMWSDLYNVDILRLTKEEAAKLPNKTHAIPGDEDHYIAELDVFHNLHCLNKIRMALDPDYYPDWRVSTTNNLIPSQRNATEHVAHCVDWIRQSIMCSGDTSVVVWQWDDLVKTTKVQGKIAHTCRKFDKLHDWAKEHGLKTKYDPTVHIEDDIVVPIFHNEIP